MGEIHQQHSEFQAKAKRISQFIPCLLWQFWGILGCVFILLVCVVAVSCGLFHWLGQNTYLELDVPEHKEISWHTTEKVKKGDNYINKRIGVADTKTTELVVDFF
ncbi:MAG: hypothetical protein JXA10_11920 [Anaerolineae bacterium]|nr:hypothetical protein [Anaerolineae bacterium]